METARDRLVAAAFDLFAERGYEGATIDGIAERAGVSRSTFFRNFEAKEDVILPNHDAILARVDQRLATASPTTREVAVTEAARLVLEHYLGEGDLARARYRLTSAVPALRAREIAGIHRYQRLFARHLRGWWAEQPDGELRAELLAAAVVAGHNEVLRRWLRDESDTPDADFDQAMRLVLDQTGSTAGDRSAATVIVVPGDRDADLLADRLRDFLAADGH